MLRPEKGSWATAHFKAFSYGTHLNSYSVPLTLWKSDLRLPWTTVWTIHLIRCSAREYAGALVRLVLSGALEIPRTRYDA